MRVLYIGPYLPSRTRVRSFEFLQRLGRRHRITALGLANARGTVGDGVEQPGGVDLMSASRSQVESLWHAAFDPFINGTPPRVGFDRSRRFQRLIRETLLSDRYDVVHLESVRALQYVAVVNAAAPAAGVVYDAVDSVEQYLRQVRSHHKEFRRSGLGSWAALVHNGVALWLDARLVASYEARLATKADCIVATTAADLAGVLQAASEGVARRGRVIPNGVDGRYWHPQTDVSRSGAVFIGRLGYLPNELAAMWIIEQLAPALREECPFVIVGEAPGKRLRALASRQRTVQVLGYQEDVRPLLWGAKVAVVPIRIAVGIQNKVLEALSCGVPVVVSDVVARRLALNSDYGVFAANSAADFAACIRWVLDNYPEAKGRALRGRQEVVARFSWEQAVASLEDGYAVAIQNRRQRNATLE